VVRNERIMHGKTSPVFHDGRGLFAGLSNPFEATRYHSLVIRKDSLTDRNFEVCAWTAENEIMGLRHRFKPLHGVQFHPESFLTVEGPRLLNNFLNLRAA
jgi:anthranilate synthase/aminodeoxychorismate synthase-like glutamine amidotransferase